jgi:endonuclease YncB( thermonuclease family)
MQRRLLKPILGALAAIVIGVTLNLVLSIRHGGTSVTQTDITGHVINVSDGDSITVRTGETNLKIRLAQIDAPETGQPWGTRAKQALSDLVGGQEVTVKVIDQDRYGRWVAQIDVDGLDVNHAMVARGAAWAYTAYLTDESLRAVEAQARADQLGLWAMPEGERVAPWDYRKQRRAQQSLSTAR